MFARPITAVRHGLNLSQMLLAFSFVLGLIFAFVVPPFQKPDEPSHFYKAISLASGNVLCQKGASPVFQNQIPKYLFDFPTQMLALHIASGPQVAFPLTLYPTYALQTSFDRSLVNEPSSCSLPFILYIPVSLILATPVAVGMNPLFIFYLGRLANFLIGFALFYFAYRVAPKKTKLIPLFVLSLPIVLYQLSSFSKDALHLAAGMVAFCLWLSFFNKKQLHPRQVLTFLFATAIAVLARPQYMFLLLLALVIPYQKVTATRLWPRLTSLVFIFFMLTLVGLFLSKEIYSAKASSLGTVAPATYVYPNLQLEFLKEHWREVPRIVSRTFESNSVYYLQGTIGLLGWLEYGVAWYVYLFYLFLGVYVFLKSAEDLPRLTFFQLAVIVVILFGTLAGILLSFYFYASPVAAPTVLGIQGRYFLLLIPYFFLLLASLKQRLGNTLIALWLGVMIISIFLLISYRYYDSSRHFYRNDEGMSKSTNAGSLVIDQAVTQKVIIENNKKLTGVSIFVIGQEAIVEAPYQLEVLDETCSKSLQNLVIDTKNLQQNSWNDVLFAPIAGRSSVCIRLSPYHLTLTPNQSLLIAADQPNQVSLIPIYLY